MQIHISITDTAASIEALELAINALTMLYDGTNQTNDLRTGDRELRVAIEELQMMLVAYRLIERNAAKEQRKGRASQPTPLSNPNDAIAYWLTHNNESH